MTSIPCQFTSPDSKKKNYERIALCTLRKASLTVEASVILPVFLLAMTMLISVIDVCRVKVEAQAELTQQAKKLSMYAYAASEIYENEYVDLYKIETYDLPVKLFPFQPVKLAIRARVHTWTGRSDAENNAASDSEDASDMVYITERETVYHTNENCTHLDLSIMQTDKNSLSDLRNEVGGKYYACEKCCGSSHGNDSASYGSIYYITENGSSYHVSLNCSSLKRTTKLVKKSEVTHLEECERCKVLNMSKK